MRYTPVNTDQDRAVTSDPIFLATSPTSVSVGVPGYSVVVVHFPKG